MNSSISPELCAPVHCGARLTPCFLCAHLQAASRVVIDTDYKEVTKPLDELSTFFAYSENHELAAGKAMVESELQGGECAACISSGGSALGGAACVWCFLRVG